MKIWFDTEFIDTGSKIKPISIGMVREDGAMYYAEWENIDWEDACPWVMQNVEPHLTGPTKLHSEIAQDVHMFCGEKPEFWGYFAAYDWVVLSQLYGRMIDLPGGWPQYCMDVMQLQKMSGIRIEMEHGDHNALQDALRTKILFDRTIERIMNDSDRS